MSLIHTTVDRSISLQSILTYLQPSQKSAFKQIMSFVNENYEKFKTLNNEKSLAISETKIKQDFDIYMQDLNTILSASPDQCECMFMPKDKLNYILKGDYLVSHPPEGILISLPCNNCKKLCSYTSNESSLLPSILKNQLTLYSFPCIMCNKSSNAWKKIPLKSNYYCYICIRKLCYENINLLLSNDSHKISDEESNAFNFVMGRELDAIRADLFQNPSAKLTVYCTNCGKREKFIQYSKYHKCSTCEKNS